MDNVATVDTGAATAAPPPLMTDEMSAGELAYFNSRGEDASGLDLGDGVAKSAPAAGDVEAQPGEYDPEEVTVDATGKARTKDGKFVKAVPHSVFHAKNEKLKQIASDLAAEREGRAKDRETLVRADERLTLLNSAIAGNLPNAQPGAQAGATGPIDPEKDLFGALKQAVARIQELETSVKANDEKHTTTHTETQRLQAFKSAAESFMATTPDFTDAFTHLASTRHVELELAGISDPKQRDAIIGRDARALVSQAEKEGKNPAQRLYDIAKARGYQPKAKPGAAAATIDPNASEAAKVLERANANQAASITLGGAGGAAQEKIDLRTLGEMSEPAFIAYMDGKVAKYGKPAWDKYMRTGNAPW